MQLVLSMMFAAVLTSAQQVKEVENTEAAKSPEWYGGYGGFGRGCGRFYGGGFGSGGALAIAGGGLGGWRRHLTEEETKEAEDAKDPEWFGIGRGFGRGRGFGYGGIRGGCGRGYGLRGATVAVAGLRAPCIRRPVIAVPVAAPCVRPVVAIPVVAPCVRPVVAVPVVAPCVRAAGC